MTGHSIFNDVLGPVMAGPSSSHSAGCARIGRMTRMLWGKEIKKAVVIYDSQGSYPSTCVGQGSNFGFTGGLLGMKNDDPRIKDSIAIAKESGVDISFEVEKLSGRHPNEARIDVYGDSGEVEMSVLTLSVGGGMFEIVELDGQPVYLDGSRKQTCTRRGGVVVSVEPILPVPMKGSDDAIFTTARGAIDYAAEHDWTDMWKLALDYECSLGDVTEEDVWKLAEHTLNVMREAAKAPDPEKTEMFGFLPYQCRNMQKKMGTVKTVSTGCLDKAMFYAVAVMENSCAHNIVTASPTAGSSGVIPASIVAVGEEMGCSDEEIMKGLLAAGLAGACIANQATFGAEVAGCQAENGAASAMAAAGVVQLLGGDVSRGFAAASMALQNMLGLICDPVGGLTEIPCISRNVAAVSNAVMSANMVMLGFDPVIPYDETILSMYQVGKMLPSELRCTCGGGLCTTKTGKGIAEQLQSRK